jgi:hypothetical protein
MEKYYKNNHAYFKVLNSSDSKLIGKTIFIDMNLIKSFEHSITPIETEEELFLELI